MFILMRIATLFLFINQDYMQNAIQEERRLLTAGPESEV